MNGTNIRAPFFEACCRATTIGSLPHTDIAQETELIFEYTPQIPSWVQFPKRNLYENMMVQFSEGMPALVQEGDRFHFDTSISDCVKQLTDFYDRFLAATEAENSEALDNYLNCPKDYENYTERHKSLRIHTQRSAF